MSSFIIELVSSASCDVYANNSLASFTNFLPNNLELDGEWEVSLLEISYPSLYNNITEGKFWYVTKEEQEKVNNNNNNRSTHHPSSGGTSLNINPDTGLDRYYDPLYIDPGLYLSLEEILTAMETALKKKNRNKKMGIKWNVNTFNRVVEIQLPDKDSQFVVGSRDLSSILGFSTNIWFKGVGPHKSLFPVDILRIHSLMVYTDIVEYSIIGDTKAPVLRCFPFAHKLERETINVTKFTNHTAFDNLQFRKVLKNSIHSIQIELRAATGELIPFVAVGVTRLTLMFRPCKND